MTNSPKIPLYPMSHSAVIAAMYPTPSSASGSGRQRSSAVKQVSTAYSTGDSSILTGANRTPVCCSIFTSRDILPKTLLA